MVTLRLLPAAASLLLLGLGACAHEDPSPWGRDLALLRDEVRALRSEREGDRRKLEALEAHVGALARRNAESARAPGGPAFGGRSAPAGGPAGGSAPAVEIPRGLSVVRVQPGAGGAGNGADDGVVAFIADMGDGAPTRSSRPSRAALGGPTGGPDVAPPLPTEIDLQAPGELPAAPVPPAAYQAALSSLASGDAASAAMALEQFVRDAPRDAAADNALLALGDAYLRVAQPGRALKAYERVATEYPAGDAVAQALLRYGETCLTLGRTAAARAAFQRVAEDHAGSAPATTALERLKSL